MCSGIKLDERQRELLRICTQETKQPNRSLLSRLRTNLTMITIGMYAATARVPDYCQGTTTDEDNRPF
jgi:hypothetical protein